MSKQAIKLKQDSSEESLSVNDYQAKQYMELTAEIAALDKQVRILKKDRDVLKAEFVHRGTYTTRHYVIAISERNVAEYTVAAQVQTIVKVSKRGEL